MHSENSHGESKEQGYWFDLNIREEKKTTKPFMLEDMFEVVYPRFFLSPLRLFIFSLFHNVSIVLIVITK